MNLLFLTGLFFIGLIAIIVEFFVPAAGIIGIIGGGCIINEHNAMFGRNTTGPEIQRIMEVLQLE